MYFGCRIAGEVLEEKGRVLGWKEALSRLLEEMIMQLEEWIML